MLRVTGAWRAAMRAAPRSWDDGLDGAAQCHDLCLVCVRFRWKRPAGIKLVNAAAIGEHELLAGAPGTWIKFTDLRLVIFEDQWCCRCVEAVRELHDRSAVGYIENYFAVKSYCRI